MRVPQYERRRFRVRGWMIAVVVALLVLLFSLRGLAGFYTDYLWFDSLDQGDTWGRLLFAKVVPALVFTIAFFVIMLGNLVIADRLAPRLRVGPMTPEDEMVTRYRQATERYTGRIRAGVALFFALIAGIGVSAQWQEWILFNNRVDFAKSDPQFDKNIGFYVFQLPFIRFIIDWLFAGLVIVLLVTAVAYYLNGGIRFQTPGQRVTPQVKAHLSVILAVMALVKTAEYYFARFELNFSTKGAVDGAGYTQVNAELPALNLLIFISIVAAGLFIWNIWRRGWVLPIIAVGLWGFVSVVVGTIYPALIQQFRVNPNEFAKERPYIRRNINATRDAYGLSKITPENYEYTEELTAPVVEANVTTIDNSRLWDPAVLESVYGQIQEFQTYYAVDDVDVDRYLIDGEVVQTATSLREVNGNALPTQSWINEKIVYTHGYGVIASPMNQVSQGGPDFFARDIPVEDLGIGVTARGAQIYFGEQQGGYVIVGAKQLEFNYPRQGVRDSLTRYRGDDGVGLSNFVRRAAFALRYNDVNLLVSGQIRPEKSKIIMYRSIRDRVEKLAPFLRYDTDPYPVIVDGETKWVIDAYTATSKYPYSQYVDGVGGIQGRFNYVRNSVKVVVGAYDGTVDFYVVDRTDPIVKAWRQAFPDLFSDFADMPDGLKDHLRYPEDLFRIQTDVYATYHVVETRRFFQGSERWLITPDPVEAISGVTAIGTTDPDTQGSSSRAPSIRATTKRQDPYYLYISLPGDDSESFLMIQAFVPVSQDNQQLRLVSFLTAKSDRRNYGKLESFVMPQSQSVTGPVQAALEINQDTAIRSQLTLLERGDSRLVRGSVQLIPVGNSILYVQPIYVENEGSASFPVYQFVAVFAQGRDPVIASTVNEAIGQLFPATADATDGTESPGDTSTPTPTTPSTVQDLLQQAAQKFTDADAALKAGDLGKYQTLVREAQALVGQAQQLLNTQSAADASRSTAPSGSTSTSTTTTTTRPTT
ncbi:MAG: UPF0182 family protein [Actinobacteria bacterium]|nr:UPF0182 family protein [Actinomycetota bacterium]